MTKYALGIITLILMYLVAYQAGYNNGYSAGKCVMLPWQEQVECWRNIK